MNNIETSDMEYVVFTDESYITAERYRSIGALSFPKKYYAELNSKLKEILRDPDVDEFKWGKLRNAKYRYCAEKILDCILSELLSKAIRIDVMTWDTHDRRHKIQSRDDVANFERMFFHLLKFLMLKREKSASWYIYPDERLEISWQIVNDCLNQVGKWRELCTSPLFGDIFSERNFKIREFQQIKSIAIPCCQISDLFAGLSVFSINSYSKYKQWELNNDAQFDILLVKENSHFSNSENSRFTILNKLIKQCRCKRLGVSFNTNARLATPNPSNPINFWNYLPQHENDKAPIRNN